MFYFKNYIFYPQASENRDDELKMPFYVRTDLFLRGTFLRN